MEKDNEIGTHVETSRDGNPVKKLLEVEDLRIYFHIEQGTVRAVDGVSFAISPGESLGVVGESGCGKSITALSIMLLHPQPEGKIAGGRILLHRKADGPVDISRLALYGDEIRDIRGNEIAMIFQEPMTSLHPVYTVGEQIMEAIRLHQNVEREEARELAIEMLDQVKISAPRQRVEEYPHQLSGGMRQRVMIAMALSCNPSLLIADEPTTALDVTIEAQILELIRELQRKRNMSLMMITHDLGVIGEMADKVIVMYVGRVVEQASTESIFENPQHPYTSCLLQSIPRIGQKGRLDSISGSVPSPFALPMGCNFQPRCPVAIDICKQQDPPMFRTGEDHYVKCWLHRNGEVPS
jgi:oligopeptide/dipeptide ABC transporter ATP-binding protein